MWQENGFLKTEWMSDRSDEILAYEKLGVIMIFEAEHICLSLDGKNILNDINLSMEDHKIYAFVGQNGAGKTMLFRVLSGLIKANSGRVLLDGRELHKDMNILPSLGIMLENEGLYPDLSGYENLKLIASIHKKIEKTHIREVIKKVGLNPDDKKKFSKYSLGMKQRIVLAQAIMEDPDILMLDEPTNALDQDGVGDIRELILEQKRRGAIVLLASHNPEDIRMLADKIYRIREGVLTEYED